MYQVIPEMFKFWLYFLENLTLENPCENVVYYTFCEEMKSREELFSKVDDKKLVSREFFKTNTAFETSRLFWNEAMAVISLLESAWALTQYLSSRPTQTFPTYRFIY